MNNLSVEELCRDISALSLEQKPLQPSPKKSAKGSASQTLEKADEREPTEQEKAVKRALSATQKRARPVIDQYNCRENQYKFCIPITLQTARELEQDFIKEKALRLAIKQAKKKEVSVTNGKNLSDQLTKIAEKKFGADSRHNGKFVELALKM